MRRGTWQAIVGGSFCGVAALSAIACLIALVACIVQDASGEAYLAALLPTGGLAVGFFATGYPFFRYGHRLIKRDKWLRQHGQRTWAFIRAVNKNPLARGPSYSISAAWTASETGKTHYASSDLLHADPRSWLGGRQQILVLYDPQNPDTNVVEVPPAPPRWP